MDFYVYVTSYSESNMFLCCHSLSLRGFRIPVGDEEAYHVT